MEPEIEEFFNYFLARIKYPEIKTHIDPLEIFSESFKKLNTSFTELLVKKTKTPQDHFLLSLNYLGLGPETDLSKANFWVKQSLKNNYSDLGLLILQVIIYLQRDMSQNYKNFLADYQELIDQLPIVNLNNDKLFYRFIELLYGWVYDNNEFELASDLTLINSLDKNMSLTIDKLINKWIIQGRKSELYLLRLFANPKLDYYLNQ